MTQQNAVTCSVSGKANDTEESISLPQFPGVDAVSVTTIDDAREFEYWCDVPGENARVVAEYVLTSTVEEPKMTAVIAAFSEASKQAPNETPSEGNIEIELSDEEKHSTTYESVLFVTRETTPNGDTTWGVHIHFCSEETPVSDVTDPDFYKPTQSPEQLTQFIDTVVSTDENVFNDPVEYYHKQWSNTQPESPQDATETTREEGSSISEASDEYHQKRATDAANWLRGRIEHAIVINDFKLLLKVSVHDEMYFVSLPYPDGDEPLDTWEIHKSIVDLRSKSAVSGEASTVNISIADYIGQEIDISFRDKKLLCDINHIDHGLILYDSVADAVDECDCDESWLQTMLEYNCTPVGEAFAGVTPHEKTHLKLSLLWLYYEFETPIPCTVTVNQAETSADTIVLDISVDGVDKTIQKTLDMPDSAGNESNAVTAIEELGGGEIEFIDGERVYLHPKHSTAFQRNTENQPQNIGLNDSKEWWIVTESQYLKNKNTEITTFDTKISRAETAQNIGTVTMILGTGLFLLDLLLRVWEVQWIGIADQFTWIASLIMLFGIFAARLGCAYEDSLIPDNDDNE